MKLRCMFATFPVLALFVLLHGAAVYAQESNLADELYKAAQMSDVTAVQTLLDKGVDVNAKNSKGSYALNMAAVRDDVAIIKLLLDQGANVNVQNDKGESPLHCVVKYGGSPEAANILIAAGADTSLADQEGHTALDYAKKNQHHWNALVALLQ